MAQLSSGIATKVSGMIAAHGITLRGGANATYAQTSVSEADVDAGDWLHDETCLRLAWVACMEHGKTLQAAGDIRVTESRLSQFTRGAGDCLGAQAQTVFAADDEARIRVQLYRMPAGQGVAEQFLVAEYNAALRLVTGSATEVARVPAQAEPAGAANEPLEMTNRERAMETKRRQIFDGACEVIGREGYAATTMRKVAKAAGLPLSSMYQYIDTKEDLLYMITSTCMQEIFDYMAVELLADGSAEDKMQHAVEAYLKYVSKNRRYINLVYRETRALSRPNREKIFDIERRFTEMWEQVIIEGNKNGEFDAHKSRLAANLIYFVCNLWSLRYWAVQDYTEDEVREYLQRFILGGLQTGAE